MRTKLVLAGLLFFVIVGNVAGGWTPMGGCAAVLGGVALGLEFIKDRNKKTAKKGRTKGE